MFWHCKVKRKEYCLRNRDWIREYQKEYKQRPEARALNRKLQARYRRTPHVKAVKRAYERTPKAKRMRRVYYLRNRERIRERQRRYYLRTRDR